MARKGRRYPVPRPFVKWAGGKGQVLPELRASCPELIGRYHEPFLGGGALFFNLKPAGSMLSDTNRELIDCYVTVRDRVDELIAALAEHPYDKDHYYAVRELDPWELDPIARAARMIYMNKAGFNGLYRVNSKGKFNVPFGRYVNPTICDEENLTACAATLAAAELRCASFETVVDHARPGDFVYFDPPYIPLSKTAYFTAYQKRGFGMDNQERLAQVFDALGDAGINAMLSNSDVEWVHDRYRRHNVRVIKANRLVNCDGSRRGPVGEVVITNY